MAIRLGTAGVDDLRTAVANITDDFVWADSGDDVVWTYGADDEISGGEGNDTLLGGDGVDIIFGYGSKTTWLTMILGARGQTLLYEDDKPETWIGIDVTFSDDDFITGGAGNDRLYGGFGNDTIYGSNAGQSLGSGHDYISGGPGNDILHGNDGNDTIDGGPGNDNIDGGDGIDTVTFASSPVAVVLDLALPQVATDIYVSIERFAGTSFSTPEEGLDVVRLPGRPDQYRFEVILGDTWDETRTVLTSTLLAAPLDLTQFERAVFAVPFTANQLNGVNLYREMMALSIDAYSHSASAAIERGWRPLSFLELGLKPDDFLGIGPSGVDYEFSIDPDNQGFYRADAVLGLSEQTALVLAGVVNNKNTLVVSFEGTALGADLLSYGVGGFGPAFAAFQPLLAALENFIEDPESGVDQVIFTGHSLGAALAQKFAEHIQHPADVEVLGYAIANPGVDDAPPLSNFVSIEHAYDLVGNITGDVRGGRIIVDRDDLSLFTFVPPQHGKADYNVTVERLLAFASDTDNLLFFLSPVAVALNSGAIYAGGPTRILLGSNAADTLKVGAAQDMVLGGSGDDNIVFAEGHGFATPVVVDGGGGSNVVALRGPPAGLPAGVYVVEGGDVFWETSPGIRTHLIRGSGIDMFVLPDGRVVNGDGEVGPQELGEGQSIFNLQGAAGGFGSAYSGDGNQTVNGTTGADVIFLGTGSKQVFGGAGNDLIQSIFSGIFGPLQFALGPMSLGQVQSTLDGGAGADVLMGGVEDTTYIVDDLGDVVDEQADGGVDHVFASVSFTLGANVENLALTGSSATDGAGNDANNTLTGNAGANNLIGAQGDDTLEGGLGADYLDGGEGFDSASYAGSLAAVTVSLGISAAQNTLGAGTDTLVNVEALTGSDYADTLSGSIRADLLSGAAGNDALSGGDGDDTLRGGLGNDALNGGLGIDSASYDDAVAGITVSLGVAVAQNTGAAGLDQLLDIENVLGSEFNDALTGNTGVNLLSGGLGDDVLSGGGGNDTIVDAAGSSGAASINAGAGDDVVQLSGAFVSGIINGSTGNDQLDAPVSLGGLIFQSVEILNTGVAGVTGSAAQFRTFATIRQSGADLSGAINLALSAGGVLNLANKALGRDVHIAGSADLDVLTGSTGDDVMDGLGGGDTLNGGDGNDTLTGGDGPDKLDGGEGNDSLSGGTGNDTLLGGAGDDAISDTGGSIAAISAGVGDDVITLGTTLASGTVNGGGGLDQVIVSGFLRDVVYTGVETLNTSGGLITATAVQMEAFETIRVSAADTTGAVSLRLSAAGTINLAGELGTRAVTFTGSAGNDGITTGDGADTINGGVGNDTIIARSGNDLILQGAAEGRDIIDGGIGADTYRLTGTAAAETFRIYTRAEALAVGMTGLASGTEIVITRNGTDNASVITELDNIEEIFVNALASTADNGNGTVDGGTDGGDTIMVIGDFTTSSLAYSTIHIAGSNAADTVDITGLTSAHRVVFDSHGGTDTIRGDVRAQDVFNGAGLNDQRGGVTSTMIEEPAALLSFGASDGLDAFVRSSIRDLLQSDLMPNDFGLGRGHTLWTELGGLAQDGHAFNDVLFGNDFDALFSGLGRTMVETADDLAPLDFSTHASEALHAAPVFAAIELSGFGQRFVSSDYDILPA